MIQQRFSELYKALKPFLSEDNTVVVKSRDEYDQLEGKFADGVYDDFSEQTNEMGDKGIMLEDIWSRIPDYK